MTNIMKIKVNTNHNGPFVEVRHSTRGHTIGHDAHTHEQTHKHDHVDLAKNWVIKITYTMLIVRKTNLYRYPSSSLKRSINLEERNLVMKIKQFVSTTARNEQRDLHRKYVHGQFVNSINVN